MEGFSRNRGRQACSKRGKDRWYGPGSRQSAGRGSGQDVIQDDPCRQEGRRRVEQSIVLRGSLRQIANPESRALREVLGLQQLAAIVNLLATA